MDSYAILQDSLAEVVKFGDDIVQHLSSLNSERNNASVDASEVQIPLNLPDDLQTPRKRLAEAAARILQLTTDPTEYLDQLAANVCRLLSFFLTQISSETDARVIESKSCVPTMARQSPCSRADSIDKQYSIFRTCLIDKRAGASAQRCC